MTPHELITKSRTLQTRKLINYTATPYKYVRGYCYQGVTIFYAAINLEKLKWSKMFTNVRDAAIAVDMKFIEHHLNPVNILKKK